MIKSSYCVKISHKHSPWNVSIVIANKVFSHLCHDSKIIAMEVYMAFSLDWLPLLQCVQSCCHFFDIDMLEL